MCYFNIKIIIVKMKERRVVDNIDVNIKEMSLLNIGLWID